MAQIVSVRMPTTLIERLHELAPRHHYKDVSELMRGLIREEARALLEGDEHKERLIFEIKTLLRRLEHA